MRILFASIGTEQRRAPRPLLTGIFFFLFFLLLGSLGPPALAQVREVATPDELRQALGPGDDISVLLANGKAFRGRLLEVRASELDIRAEVQPSPDHPGRRQDTTIPLSAIRLLERPRDAVDDGAWLGAGIGAGGTGAMFIYALSTDRNEFDEWGTSYIIVGLIYAGIGALIGAVIDGAHSKPVIRFRTNSAASTRVRILPYMGRGAGLRLLVSF